MATPKAQRIGIWIIAIVMTLGAVGVYFVAILANNNDQAQADQQQNILKQYQSDYAKYQAKVNQQGDELSKTYYDQFVPYASRVAVFDKALAEKELATEDIVVGEGEVVDGNTKLALYYVGWNPNGKVFDQSIENGKLKAPLAVANGLTQAGLIEGWKEGLIGMKIGGVRELTIPSAKAYGSQGGGSDDIPADTPLKFVVMAIPLPEQFPEPETPKELQQY